MARDLHADIFSYVYVFTRILIGVKKINLRLLQHTHTGVVLSKLQRRFHDEENYAVQDASKNGRELSAIKVLLLCFTGRNQLMPPSVFQLVIC